MHSRVVGIFQSRTKTASALKRKPYILPVYVLKYIFAGGRSKHLMKPVKISAPFRASKAMDEMPESSSVRLRRGLGLSKRLENFPSNPIFPSNAFQDRPPRLRCIAKIDRRHSVLLRTIPDGDAPRKRPRIHQPPKQFNQHGCSRAAFAALLINNSSSSTVRSASFGVPGDLLDRLALEEMLAPNPTNRLHCQHSATARFESKRAAHQAQWEGSILDPDPPVQGVKIARRITSMDELVDPPKCDCC